jgi:hypothetical protein
MNGNTVLDTVTLELTKKEAPKKSDKNTGPAQLIMSTSIKGSGLNQFKHNLIFAFSYPLIRWDFSRFFLIEDKDTVHPKIEFTDSLKRKIIIHHKWSEDKTYKIMVPDSVFYGINNISHDTLRLDFKTKSERDFGNLILSMNMQKRPGQYIIQLLDEKESIVFEEQLVPQSGKVSFNFMPAGKYKIKAIHDRNNNLRWDTGNYKRKIQPEDVIYFPKTLEIRSNWDIEENWD